jgi:hypothetical protein
MKTTTWMKPLLAAVVLFYLAAPAFAGETITRAPQSYVLHDGAGSVIKSLPRYGTIEECEVAALALFVATRSAEVLNFRCVQVVGLTIRGHCDDVPKPAPPTDTVLDPTRTEPGGPMRKICTAEEKLAGCVDEPATTWPDEPGVIITPEGTTHVFEYVGKVEVKEQPDGSWHAFETTLAKVPYIDGCWDWVTVETLIEPIEDEVAE